MRSTTVTNFTIRVATPEDEQSVNNLLAASYSLLMQQHYDKSLLKAVLPMLGRVSPLLLASGTYYLTETEDKSVVGCGGWTRESPELGEIIAQLGHIRHFATHPEWVGRGVGRSIYLVCERAAKSAGVIQFHSNSSLNAESFYASLGFEVTQKIDVQLGDRVSVPGVLMQRHI
jgi:N-acetylglutamate synthase-like GNAT family acetyltransferase